MFPIHDENPTLRTPIVTISLIAVTAMVWLFIQGAGGERALGASICAFGLIPAELTLDIGGERVRVSQDLVCQLQQGGAWHTLITSMFMHGGWFHLLGNMWFLWIFGNNVEDSMGRSRFLLFYLLCGLGAAAGQILVSPSSVVPMVGASGAIGGVMGAYIVLYPRVRVTLLLVLGFFITTVQVPAVLMLGYWFALQLISGLPQMGGDAGGVAFWAHVGGFISGAVLIFLFQDPKLVGQHRRILRELSQQRR